MAPGAILLWVAGAMLGGAAWVAGSFVPRDDVLAPLSFALGESALLCVLLAMLPVLGVGRRFFTGLGLGLVTILTALGAAELAFRRMEWDFSRQEVQWRRLPPFCREPRTPSGTVFFRRDGPETWTGAVIRASLELRGQAVPPVYQDEPSIAVRYDRWGFREGDRGDEDWEIAVAGDSFTELGFLPFDRLFTTILGDGLGCKVRNLGVSGTGPYTQLQYLKEFGNSQSLKHVVMVFFEGNDLEDMDLELDALRRFEETGERPSRDFVKQTSMLGAVAEVSRRVFRGRGEGAEGLPVHTFLSAGGEIPVHLTEWLPHQRRLPEDAELKLDRFLAEYGAYAEGRGVKGWLAFMPCKARVLQSRLRLSPRRSQGREPWWSETLPGLVATACERHGVTFLDLSPALIEDSRDRGELVFNPLFEFHLNARGSECVGRELIRQFRARGVHFGGR